MKIEEYEIHDDWDGFFDRKDFNSQYYKGFSLTPKFGKKDLTDGKFEYGVYFNAAYAAEPGAGLPIIPGLTLPTLSGGELFGWISDAQGQNVYFDNYEKKEKDKAQEYDYFDDGSLYFKFDIKMSPKKVLERLKEIANGSKYLNKIVGNEKYL